MRRNVIRKRNNKKVNMNDLLNTVDKIQNNAKKVEYFLNCVQELKDKLNAYDLENDDLPEDLNELSDEDIIDL